MSTDDSRTSGSKEAQSGAKGEGIVGTGTNERATGDCSSRTGAAGLEQP